MAHVHVPDWSPEQVVVWLRGLDDVLLPYTHNFLNNGITGRHLVCFAADDLPHLGVTKLGHQELILEAVELLKQFYHNLETENLQWLSLRLACKARSLYKELSYQEAMNPLPVTTSGRCQDRVSTKTLSTVVDVINAVKVVVSWLDRSPFNGQEFYVNLRNDLLKSSIVLATNAQRDSFAEEPNVVIKNICCKMAEHFDELTKNNCDSLFIQPTHLEIAVVKKKPNEELGMHIQSLFSGIHVIGGVRFQSPAGSCGRGRIEMGDEIVQVNYQTVIGWHQKNLVSLMKGNPTEVILTLKKRPMHSNTFGQVIPHKLFFPMKKPAAYSAKHDWDPSASAPVTISITDVNNHTSSIPNLNIGNAVEVRVDPVAAVETVREPAHQEIATHILPETAEDDDDDSTFLPEEVTKSQMSGELLHLATPRVQVTLQRRCTVSGGSPTAERPPVSMDQLWNGMKREQVMRSLSHDVTRAEWRWRMSEFTPRQLETIASSVSPLVPQSVERASSEDEQLGTANRQCDDVLREEDVMLLSERGGLSETVAGVEIIDNIDVTDGATPSSAIAMDVPETVRFTGKSVKFEEVCPQTKSQSYQVVIVGGVPQVAVVPKEAKKLHPESPVLRHKTKSLQAAANRRISCKDLGQGDCQGWLLKGQVPKGSLVGFKWRKAWCVLKGRYFYVFRDVNATKAECFISLPAFHVSPAAECKSKKFGFKVYNAGATFYFASDSQTDMSKWMNKMGLAAIEYEGTMVSKTVGTTRSPKANREEDEYFSETDDSDDSIHEFHRPIGSPLQKSATVNTVADAVALTPSMPKRTWGGSLPRLSSSRKNYEDRPKTPATIPLSPNLTRVAGSSAKKQNLEEYRSGTLPVSFSKRKFPSMMKSGSLEWKTERRKNVTEYVPTEYALSSSDHACSEPTVYGGGGGGGHCPVVEPGAKMALAFEMNLDSSSPPRESHSGDESAASGNRLPKTSLRLFGSPKFVKKLSKIREACNVVSEKVEKTSNKGFGSCDTTVRENARCQQSQSQVQVEVGVEVARAPTKKPAMGVSMIGKQRRTSSQSSGESLGRSQTLTRSQGTTITQATQTDEARLAALALHDDGDFGLWVDDDGQNYDAIACAVNVVHVGERRRQVIGSRQACKNKLRMLKRSLRGKVKELDDIESLLASPVDSASLRAFAAKYPYLKSCP